MCSVIFEFALGQSFWIGSQAVIELVREFLGKCFVALYAASVIIIYVYGAFLYVFRPPLTPSAAHSKSMAPR